jgi:NADH-quinone oxidoreductase subunit I
MAIVKVSSDFKNKMCYRYFYPLEILRGLKLTLSIFLKQFFKLEKSETIEWPEKKYKYSDRFKGKHFLTLREDGQLRCVACYLCSTRCPADCIHIEAGEHPDNKLEKYPIRFEIDILRCVFCGYCEEACPVDAIRLGDEYCMVGNKDKKWVYDIKHLSQRSSLKNLNTKSIKKENEKSPEIYNKKSRQSYI